MTEVVPFPVVRPQGVLQLARFASRDSRGGHPYMRTVALIIRPNSSQSRHSLGGNSAVRAGADQDFFQAADELHCAKRLALAIGSRESTQIEDRVANELAWAMKRYIATAIAFEKPDSTPGQHLRRRDNIRSFRVATQCDDWKMLEQQQDVPDLLFFPKCDQPLLQA
jgi:hypothetical protein